MAIVTRWVRGVALGAVLVTAFAFPRPARAQAAAEAAVKAAFLHNFLKFTEWPEDIVGPGMAMVACITDSAVASEFDRATAGRAVDGHPLALRRIKWNELPAGCAIYYISGVDAKKLPALLAGAQAAGALSVSDDAGFVEHGGMVGLFIEDGHMRFAVNTGAAERARLHLSAKLLNLAKIVRGLTP